MANNMNELDKIFRSKLENHTAEYSEQSWDKIQSRLVKQESKPKKFPWLWMSLLAVVLSGVIYLWSDINDLPSKFTDSDTNSQDINTDLHNKTDHTESVISNSTASLDLSGDLTVNNSVEGANESSILSANNIATNITVATTNRIGSSTNENQSKIIRADQTVDNSELSKLNIGVDSDTNYTSLAQSILNVSVDLGNFEEATMASTVKEGSFLADGTNATNEKLNIVTNRALKIRPLRTIGVSSFTTLQSEKELTQILLSNSMMDDFRQDCPSFVTDRTGIYLDLYVSHELPFTSLKAKNEALDSYAELRSNSEGPSYSFSAGARLTLMLPNGLGLKTGLNYSEVHEKFSHVDNDSDMVKAVITITTVGGVEVRDTNTVIIPGTRDIVSTNKYRSFDIPLLLSYEWDVRERTYMTVNGGAYLNLFFKESGKILSPSGEVIDLADSSGDKLAIFKNNIGLSLFGSVGLHYRLNSSIDLIVEPNVRLLVKSATVDAYSLEHKWITGGLITGMRYNF